MMQPNLVARLRRAVLMVGLLFFGGATAYFFIFGGRYSYLDCFYMTVLTVSTVGFHEVIPVSAAWDTKALTILLIVTGMGTTLYFVSSVTAFIIEGDLKNILWRRRMDNTIKALSDHIIVCGVGGTGYHAAQELAAIGAPFVLIDDNREQAERISGLLGAKIPWVIGDATEDSVLIAAGVERANGLITTLKEDKDNVYTVLTARQINPKLRIVSRVVNSKAAPKLRQAGADKLVSPSEIGAFRMVSELVRPQVTTFLDNMLSERNQTLRLEEIVITPTSALAGKELQEANLRQFGNILVLAAKTGSGAYTYTPGPDLCLEEGMTLIVLGPSHEVARVRQGLPSVSTKPTQ